MVPSETISRETRLKLRRLRRRIAAESAREQRSLLRIVNNASIRRSQKRHRFMLLSAAIVGVAGPVLLQRPVVLDAWSIKLASVLLLLTVAIGAIFDAIDDRRTNPVRFLASSGLTVAKALEFAEDSALLNPSEHDDGNTDALIDQWRAKTNSADARVRAAGERFAEITVFEAVLFYGTFVAGLAFLILAAARAA